MTAIPVLGQCSMETRSRHKRQCVSMNPEEKKDWITHKDILENYIPGICSEDCNEYRVLYQTVLDLLKQKDDDWINQNTKAMQLDKRRATAPPRPARLCRALGQVSITVRPA